MEAKQTEVVSVDMAGACHASSGTLLQQCLLLAYSRGISQGIAMKVMGIATSLQCPHLPEGPLHSLRLVYEPVHQMSAGATCKQIRRMLNE